MSSILTTVTRRRGRHRWTSPLRHSAVSFAIIGATSVILFSSCGTTTPSSPSPSPSPSIVRPLPGVPVGSGGPAAGGPVGHAVVYQATAPAHVTVVYPSLGTVATQAAAASPWSHSATVSDDDLGLVSLAAGNPDDLGGPVTCTILIDGRVAAHHTATGPYASVLCSLAVSS